jgi:hypothetical protein
MANDKPITEQEIELAVSVAKLMIELDDKQLELVNLLDKKEL